LSCYRRNTKILSSQLKHRQSKSSSTVNVHRKFYFIAKQNIQYVVFYHTYSLTLSPKGYQRHHKYSSETPTFYQNNSYEERCRTWQMVNLSASNRSLSQCEHLNLSDAYYCPSIRTYILLTLYPRKGSNGISDIASKRPRFTKMT
jgi:hypothetical protein